MEVESVLLRKQQTDTVIVQLLNSVDAENNIAGKQTSVTYLQSVWMNTDISMIRLIISHFQTFLLVPVERGEKNPSVQLLLRPLSL